jgi:hypothetical protein
MMPVCLVILFLSVFASPALPALDFFNGRIKLVIHENTGYFSLYYLADIPRQRDVYLWRYEPFFVDNDPRTSFLAVTVNDRTYRLGESSSFRVRIPANAAHPAIVFESPFLSVTQEFTFIRTAGSVSANGVRMTVKLENRGAAQAFAGLRFLLDTNLGEGSGLSPFTIGRQIVSNEFVIDSQRNEPYWISRNNRIGLMGSVAPEDGPKPDTIHFANWKRLSEVPWKLVFSPGRNFNYLPDSINDSAVSYNFDPQPLAAGASRNYVILLSMMDENGFFQAADASDNAPLAQNALSAENSREQDLITLRDLITRLDENLSGRLVLSNEELAEIETIIAGLKARYGLR